MSKIILAPGVTFEEDVHQYWYKGNQLSGVTRKVGESCGYKKITEDTQFILSEARDEGLLIHKAIEDWIKSDRKTWNTIHPAAVWVKNEIEKMKFKHIQAETLVSDFKTYASAIDIMTVSKKGLLSLYDIKRKFDRPYVTKQVSIYKYFIENCAKEGWEVEKIYCFGTKDMRLYELEYIGDKEVRKILYG